MSYVVFEEDKIPLDCPICYSSKISHITLPDCYHTFCTDCITKYLETLITESQVSNITCPLCSLTLLRPTLLTILSKELLDKYDKFALRETLINNPYVKFCPQPDCEGYGMGNLNKKKLACNKCQFEYCFFCVEKWHGNTKCQKVIDEDFEKWATGHNVKFCPKCKRRVEKKGGCPNMSCICGHVWCWRCGKSAGDPDHDIKCLIGTDIWNIKRTVIILMIFAPILVYFIPAVFIIVLLDMMNEGEESIWIIRNRRYFYPLLILSSPLIEILAILFFIVSMSCVFTEKNFRKFKWFAFPALPLGLVLFSGISAIGIAGGIILSFIACVAGIVLLILKYIGRLIGKKSKEINFYPQVLE